MTNLQNEYWKRVETTRHNKEEENLKDREIQGDMILRAFKIGTDFFTGTLKAIGGMLA